MSKVTINESTLTAIGDAIREKTGKTDLIAPGSMPTEISSIEAGGGGGDIEVEPIVLSGNCDYACAGAMASKYIEMFSDTVSTSGVTSSENMFYSYENSSIPFDINFDNSTYRVMDNMFNNSRIKEVPVMTNVYPSSLNSMFNRCYYLRHLPDDFGSDWNWSRINTYNYANISYMFYSCYSLRTIPKSFLQNLYNTNNSSSCLYGTSFCMCRTLDEINGLAVSPATLTSNRLGNEFQQCFRLKNLTFDLNEDGSAKTANWKSQVITAKSLGYCSSSSLITTYITGYNSGITEDKEVADDATYQALKNDPDWFTCNIAYSRYNHDSAVNTINSLPDTSEYLAAKGGTNTISFTGASGELTDGGAINTLTEEEIAVAAAKGWTVVLL